MKNKLQKFLYYFKLQVFKTSFDVLEFKSKILKLRYIIFIVFALSIFHLQAQTPPGNALNFDGTNDIIQMSDVGLGTGDFTLETWIYWSSATETYLITNRNSGVDSSGNWFAFKINPSGKPAIRLSNSGSAWEGSAASGLTLNQWYHLAVVRQGTVIRFYINGALDKTITGVTSFNLTHTNSALDLGDLPGGRKTLSGSMDEVRIWTLARTTSQIQALMNMPLLGTESGLRSYYPFDQGTPGGGNRTVTSLTDKSSFGNNGLLVNFALSGSSSNWILSGARISTYPYVDFVVKDKTDTVPDSDGRFFVCSGNVTLEAKITNLEGITIYPDQFYWVNQAGLITFSKPNSQATDVLSLTEGESALVEWTVVIGNNLSSGRFYLNHNGFVVDAGKDQNVCATTASLAAILPLQITGTWSNSGNVTIENPKSPTTNVVNLKQGDNIFKYTVTGNGCTIADSVNVVNNTPTKLSVSASSSVVCNNTVKLTASTPGTGETGKWSNSSGGTANFSNANNQVTDVTGLNPNKIYTFVWTVAKSSCYLSSTIDVTSGNLPANAGPDQTICVGNQVKMAATNPSPAGGRWSGPGTIANANDSATLITNLPRNLNTFTWTLTNAVCPSSDNVTIINYTPSTPGVRANKTAVCDASEVIIYATKPVYGTGSWTAINTTGQIFLAQADSVFNVKNLQFGKNTFRWTINYLGCTQSVDIVIDLQKIQANAGNDKIICVDTLIMGANAASPGSGRWSVISGKGSFVNQSDEKTIIKSISRGRNIYKWTIINGQCQTYDTVIVDNNMVIANAGPDQKICADTTTLNATLDTYPGTWTGNTTALISNSKSNRTKVTALAADLNKFAWKVTNSSCSATDTIYVYNYSVTAFAGVDRTVCQDTTSLQATKPKVGYAFWSLLGSNAVIANIIDPLSKVSKLPLNISTKFIWQVTRLQCTATDTVSLLNGVLTANAGSNALICSDKYVMKATAVSWGTGKWTTTGMATISNPNYNLATVENLAFGANTFTWTVSTSSCKASAQVVITNNQPNTKAGPDQYLCTDSTNLKAEKPPLGTGTWRFVNSTGILSNPNDPLTKFTKIPAGPVFLAWQVVYGRCAGADTVVIYNYKLNANAGPDKVVCADSVNLEGNLSEYGKGKWTSNPTSVLIADVTNPTTFVRKLNLQRNVFTWTLSNQYCYSSDEVVITNKQVNAIVGPDKSICENSTGIQAEKPLQGVGLWTGVDNNAIIVNPAANETNVSNLAFGINMLKWTVSLDNCSASAILQITNKHPQVNAGKDTIICSNSVILNGKTAPGSKTEWTLLRGKATLSDVSKLSLNISDLNLGANLFLLTASNESCTKSDTVIVTNSSVSATTIKDMVTCLDSFVIYAKRSPMEGTTGFWTVKNGAAKISKLTDTTYLAKGLVSGQNILTWTVKNDNCQASQDLKVLSNAMSVNFNYQVKANSTEVTFTGLSDSKPTNWRWDFGDGSEGSGNSVSHTFLAENQYNVCLSVYDSRTGCTASQCKPVDAGKVNCRAYFTYKPVSENDSTIQFTDLSVGNLTNYSWKFDDGTTSTEKNPKHAYSRSAVYNVCLVVANTASNCVSDVCKLIKVGNPVCDLGANFDYFVDGSNVYFRNTTTGRTNSWYWGFGDQSTSAQQNPVHKYASINSYTVRLSVYDSIGRCAGSFVKQIDLKQPDCNASFNFYYSPDNDKQVVFKNLSSGNINKYYWNFGDDSSSGLKDDKHTYKDPDVYHVELVIADTVGKCRDYTSMDIPVGMIDCDARFDYFIDSLSTTVYFFNKPLMPKSLVYWTFGDGTKSTEQNPIHKYSKPGYYVVSLVTSNDATGCMDHRRLPILVNSPASHVQADFNYQVDETGGKVYFYNLSEGNNLTYIWNFFDSSIENSKDPVHYFSKPGYYNVCLSVYNNLGLSDIVCKVVNIPDPNGKPCNADFIFTVDEKNKTLNFKDISTGNPDSWKWDFDDKGTSEIQNPSHVYSVNGMYRVHLHITNSKTQCSDHQIKYVNLTENEGLFMTFGHVLNNIFFKSGGYPTDFMSSSFGTPAKAVWDFGDGTKDSTSLTPNHTYKEAGTYKVCLTGTDPVTNIKTTTCKEIVISAASGISSSAKMNISLSNYPNPFSSFTYISYLLTENTYVNLSIYDVLGHKVAEIANRSQSAGIYTLEWNRKDIGVGVYFLNLKTPNGSITKKMIIAE